MSLTGESALDDAKLDLLSIDLEHWSQVFRVLQVVRATGANCVACQGPNSR